MIICGSLLLTCMSHDPYKDFYPDFFSLFDCLVYVSLWSRGSFFFGLFVLSLVVLELPFLRDVLFLFLCWRQPSLLFQLFFSDAKAIEFFLDFLFMLIMYPTTLIFYWEYFNYKYLILLFFSCVSCDDHNFSFILLRSWITLVFQMLSQCIPGTNLAQSHI